MPYVTQKQDGAELNRPYEDDLPVHRWYRFVLSFPPHLVRDIVEKFAIADDQCILDPFCGTGTTLVEAKKLGIDSIGIEANPIVHFAASVKTDWNVDPEGLRGYAKAIAEHAQTIIDTQGLDLGPLFQLVSANATSIKKLSIEQECLLIKNSISPLPLHKILTLLDVLNTRNDVRFDRYAKLALAKQAVHSISNLRFGPEIGVGKIKKDAPVISSWYSGVQEIVDDLEKIQHFPNANSVVCLGDARQARVLIQPASVDAVITSPPYPNEKDYSRSTRLEAVLLGFLSTIEDLRAIKKQLIRSNTRGIYKGDQDDAWIQGLPRIQALADSIEQRRLELKKTSGFERLYAEVVRQYFGGIARHLEELKPLLKPGAKLAYVVGDQASYFRIMIHTGQILAEIADSLGYQVLGVDLFRTRFSTVTQDHLREEIIFLKWNGGRA
jgi:DNA modification methylase